MASWWMNENDCGEGDDSRSTISKRDDFPENWIASQEPVAFKGLLKKLATSWGPFSASWQTRYWELRGAFLVYYHSAPHSATRPEIPAGAINLKQLTLVEVTQDNVLLLKSKEHEVRLKSLKNDLESPSVSDWLHALEENRQYFQNVGNVNFHLTSKELEFSDAKIGEKNVILTDEFKESSTISSAGRKNVTETSHHSFGGDASSVDENSRTSIVSRISSRLSLRSLNNTKGDLELGYIDDSKSSNQQLRFSASQSSVSSAQDESSTPNSALVRGDADIPPRLKFLLGRIGVLLRKDGATPVKIARRKLWLRYHRAILYFACFAFIILPLIAESRADNFSSCSSSIHVTDDGQVPCLLVFARVIEPISYGSSAIFVYSWLIFVGSDPKKLIRTHRARMTAYVDRFVLLVYALTAMSIIAVTVAAVHDSNPTKGFAVSGGIIIRDILFGLLYGVILSPGFVVVTLYYAETRRLRLMLKDILVIWRHRPFNFCLASTSYVEMTKEWQHANSWVGKVAGINSAFNLLHLLCEFTVTFYNGKIPPEENSLVPNAVVGIMIALPPLILTVYAMMAANERANKLNDEITHLIATSSASSTSLSIDDRASISKVLASRGSTSLFPMARPGDGSMMDHMTGLDHGIDAMKLAALLERSPCELNLLGRKISRGDIAGFVALLLVVQLVNFLGLTNSKLAGALL